MRFPELKKYGLFCLIALLGLIITTPSQAGFIKNVGQWQSDILYQKSLGNGHVFVLADKIVFQLHDPVVWSEWMEARHHREENPEHFPPELNTQVFYLHFEGNPKAIIKEFEQHHPVNIHNAKGSFNTGDYQKIVFENIYSGVSLEIVDDGTLFKYNVLVENKRALKKVKFRYQGLEGFTVTPDSLILETVFGNVTDYIPVSYQILGEETQTLECKYKDLGGNQFGFYSEDRLWKQAPAVIDPELVFSTYSGSTSDNFGFTATYDEEGHLYAGGISNDIKGSYPTTPGAYSTTYAGGTGKEPVNLPCDITLSKYSPDGKQLLYATYVGGSNDEYPQSIIVNSKNELVVFGTSISANFPTTNTAYQKTSGGNFDMVLFSLSADGAELLGSTYYGGTEIDGQNKELKYFYADDYRGEVNLDEDDNIYIASSTQSDNIPVTSNAYKSAKSDEQDGVIAIFNSTLTQLEYATFIGGNGKDGLYAVDVSPEGYVYASGGTNSLNIALNAQAPFNKFHGGTFDGLMVRLNLTNKAVDRILYWGTDQNDQIYSQECHKGTVWFTGQTEGTINTHKEDPIRTLYEDVGGGQFVIKFDEDLETELLATTYGSGSGKPDITINAFLVDDCGNIYISGWGGAASRRQDNNGVSGLRTTPDRIQETTDNSDFYLAAYAPQMEDIKFGSWFGGSQTSDHVDGGTSRFDKRGVIYQSVCSSCPNNTFQKGLNDFPTTAGVVFPNNVSIRCSNASFKIKFINQNNPPTMLDTLIETKVGETINLNYLISDRDKDTFDVTIEALNFNPSEFTSFPQNKMMVHKGILKFGLNAGCVLADGDTLVIKVSATDRGCPSHETGTGTIRLVVTPPPLMPPPEALCLSVNEAEDQVQVSWQQFTLSADVAPYFGRVVLFKIHPDGKTEELMEVKGTQAGFYKDTDVNNPKVNDYKYYLVSYNICDQPGAQSVVMNTTKEFNIPIESTYLVNATVINNKAIEVNWAKSKENDFEKYELYRGITKGKNILWQSITDKLEINDTQYIDRVVDVEKEVGCFKIKVYDKCSHISEFSNKACNIVLKGTELPFQFDLEWNPYETWDQGVNEYWLSRSVDTGTLRRWANFQQIPRVYTDDQLDYDWGGYWYEIMAYENGGGYEATSRSNKIYLIQPPLLHVPNAFTPNDDNLNELWGIVPVFVKEYHLTIFNRWGEKVFETTDKHHIWDGFYDGEQFSNNVYIYTVSYTGWDRSVHHKSGTVTVVR